MKRTKILTEVLTSAVMRFLFEAYKLPDVEEEALENLIKNQITINEGEYPELTENANEEELLDYYRNVYNDFKVKHSRDEDEDITGDFEEFIVHQDVEDFFDMNITVNKGKKI